MRNSLKLAFLFLVLIMLPVAVSALDPGDINSNPIGVLDTSGVNPGAVAGFTLDNFVRTIVTLVNWFSWFVGLAAVVMGLYAGFLFITARDDSSQLAKARNTMLYAIIGIAVAVISFSIVSLTKVLLFGTWIM